MAIKKKATLLIQNIGQLVTMQGPSPRIGAAMNDLGLIKNGAVAAAGEEILAVGESEKVVGQTTTSARVHGDRCPGRGGHAGSDRPAHSSDLCEHA